MIGGDGDEVLKARAQVREKANARLSKTLPSAYSAAVKLATSGQGGAYEG